MVFSRRFIVLLLLLLTVIGCSKDPNIAIETAVAGTMEAQVVQTGVAATQEAAYTPTPPPEVLCIDLAEDFLDESGELFDRWFDAIEIADSTPRMSLAGPVGELQAIRREAENLDYPNCAVRVRRLLISVMDHSIEGYLLFMRDEAESRITAEFTQASNAAEGYVEAIGDLRAEAAKATREASITPTPVE